MVNKWLISGWVLCSLRDLNGRVWGGFWMFRVHGVAWKCLLSFGDLGGAWINKWLISG